MASFIWIHSFLFPTMIRILFQPKFCNKAITGLDILDASGIVRANVKYVCGMSDSLFSEHFCTI